MVWYLTVCNMKYENDSAMKDPNTKRSRLIMLLLPHTLSIVTSLPSASLCAPHFLPTDFPVVYYPHIFRATGTTWPPSGGSTFRAAH